LKKNPNADCSATATCTYFELASNAFYGESIAGTWRLLVTDHISDSTQGIFEKYQINRLLFMKKNYIFVRINKTKYGNV